jgi:hypothetical protein
MEDGSMQRCPSCLSEGDKALARNVPNVFVSLNGQPLSTGKPECICAYGFKQICPMHGIPKKSRRQWGVWLDTYANGKAKLTVNTPWGKVVAAVRVEDVIIHTGENYESDK